MVRVWGATAPACLLFLLLVALCARGAQAAPWQPPGAGDDDAGSPYPASQLDPRLEPQEDPRGSTGQVPPWNPAPEPASMGPTGAVLAGTGYSTPQPDVDHEPQVNLPDGTKGEGDPGSQMGSRTEALGDGLGPLRAKDKDERIKPSLLCSHIIEKIWKDLEEAAPGMVRETVPKEVLWQGSGRTLPLPGKRTEATQATATPGVDGENNANTAKPQNFGSYCIEGTAAFLVPLLLVTVACCVLIWRWRQKNQRLAAAQAAQTDTCSRSVSLYMRPDHRGMPESQAQRQRPPSVPGRPARLPPAQPPQPPHPAADQWKARDRPSTPQSLWTQTSPPRPPAPSSKGWGRPPQGAAQATVSINIE
ncbi:uncharacterized protein LOC121063182 isoform X2 [Cygnus olor]|uniref:uncharacterized protein LOC121063182 isoform X2 n=1 Tax=Cygnus olor TaxID=8869 RepID=UPI001ADE2621|nr:uncharacterized protein LOC121063182 isoform X2 [Cygnus olor]